MDDRNTLLKNTCSICLDFYENPKILQCFHTFCAKCIQDIIQSKGKLGKIHCPLCRTVIQVPRNGVEGFQTNFYIHETPLRAKPLCTVATSCHDCISPVPGETYHVVLSCCEFGTDFKKCVVTVHYTIPGMCPPPFLKVKPGGNCIELTWTGPVNNGGSPIIEYAAMMVMPDMKTCEIYRGDIPSCKVDGLNFGRRYMFAVRAHNIVGFGPWSDSLEVITESGPPEEPKDLAIEEISHNSVVLIWKEPHCSGSNITGYSIVVYKGVKLMQSLLVEATKSTCRNKIINLDAATRYTFSVQAVNKIGNGKFCESKSCLTMSDKPSPVMYIAAEVYFTCINLRWTAPRSNGCRIIQYEICLNNSRKIKVPNKEKFRIENLKSGTLYNISIRAVNSVGFSDVGNTLAVQTLARTASKSFQARTHFKTSQDLCFSNMLNEERTCNIYLSGSKSLKSDAFDAYSCDTCDNPSISLLEKYEIDGLHRVHEKPSYSILSTMKSSLWKPSMLWKETTSPENRLRRQMDEVVEELLQESLGFKIVELNILNIMCYVILLSLGVTRFEVDISEMILRFCFFYSLVLFLPEAFIFTYSDLMTFVKAVMVIYLLNVIMTELGSLLRKYNSVKHYHQIMLLRRKLSIGWGTRRTPVSIPWTMTSEMIDGELYKVTFHSDFYYCKELSVRITDQSGLLFHKDTHSLVKSEFKRRLMNKLIHLNVDYVPL
ncbi:hypothetical protein CHS0354_015582 [Potamilus streckersoni]|uniref:Uncharacterized protein n=1 Tax=Potamilus streckersoni TaxID=2493646 RepID=A0AAE0RME6_9BIVA|nr:hypothetical protein CHS0354_015582 [Potamilus streckersoni]